MVVKAAPKNQMTLDFEPGLTERYTCLRDCVATGVYQRGLSRVAIDLNESPGNLSNQLGEEPTRHMSIDKFERYLEKTGDLTPLYYLCERFLSDKQAKQAAAFSDLALMLAKMQPLMKQAGVI